MPYIQKEKREYLDNLIKDIFKEQLNVGELNYLISRIIKNLIEQKQENSDFNYQFCNGIIGVLECAKIEFYNRVVTPYENKKIEENGKLY